MRHKIKVLLALLEQVTPLVKRIDHELGRYNVTSEAKETDSYTVDLDAYWGNGWCDCPDFRIHIEPDLSKRNQADRQAFGPARCKHIQLVRLVLGLDLVETLIAQRAKYERTLKRTK